jgi:hypothetical protein
MSVKKFQDEIFRKTQLQSLKIPFGAGSLNVLFYRKLSFSEDATFP